jgi:CSLREA domain-containing protein
MKTTQFKGSKGIRLFLVIALLAASLTTLLPPHRTHAAPDATFTVDSTADVDDAAPGDGSCNNGSGACTLRAAISEANALAGADTITLPAGTYLLKIGHSEDDNATGDLDITSDITINGAGMDSTTIDANTNDRAFDIFSGATVVLNNLTITNGKTRAMFHHGQGGGIQNAGTLTLQDIAVTNCTACGSPDTPGGCDGGGIFSTGTLTIERSSISQNAAGYAAGGDAGSGGGIYNSGGTLTIRDTNIFANHAGAQNQTDYGIGRGGGIFTEGGGSAVTIENSAIYGNSTQDASVWWPNYWGEGGGIFILSGSVTITNSTISGNSSVFEGGGVYVYSGALSLAHTTVTNNTSETNNQFSGAYGGGIASRNGTVEIKNSIIIGNDDLGEVASDDCTGASGATITSLGYNLVNAGTGCPNNGLGDTTTGDAGLDPLRDNGGDTRTHALQPDSPAVNAIPNGTNGCGTTYTNDQRGETRPKAALCDIGAYELDSPEVDIWGNNQPIADGDNTPDIADHTDFGEADVNTEAITVTFTISSTGEGILELDGHPLVEIAGVGAEAFSLTAVPDAIIGPMNNSTTFQITFDPAEPDLYTAVVVVNSNVPDKSPYTYAIQGMGTGTPAAVGLADFTATVAGDAVLLAWETASEVDLLGFHVHRAEAPDGPQTCLNADLIPGQAPGSPVGAVYQFRDEAVEPGVTYWYWLEGVDVQGRATRHGPVTAQALPGSQYRIYLPLMSR